ncbi:MAG TPA: hypothetical protein VIG47_00185, partial [Gemmatimonadaceae bacterium]
SVRAKWGVPASDLLDQITTVLVPSLADRRIELVVAQIDDPPPLTPSESFGTNASLPSAVDAVRSTNPSNSALTPAPPPPP